MKLLLAFVIAWIPVFGLASTKAVHLAMDLSEKGRSIASPEIEVHYEESAEIRVPQKYGSSLRMRVHVSEEKLERSSGVLLKYHIERLKNHKAAETLARPFIFVRLDEEAVIELPQKNGNDLVMRVTPSSARL